MPHEMGEDRTALDGLEVDADKGVNTNRELLQLVCQVHRVGSGNDWRPKDVEYQALSECSEGGSNSSEECSGEDKFADGQDSISKRHVW